MAELLRADRTLEKTKQANLDSLEAHILKLKAQLTALDTHDAEVADFDSEISGNTVAINATVMVTKIRQQYTLARSAIVGRIAGERAAIAALETTVSGSDDYTAAEKQEYLDAKNNEV